MTLVDHAYGIAQILGREWETPTGTATRAWHAMFTLGGAPCYATLVQTRAVPGFRVLSVRWRYVEEMLATPTAIGAAVWLGLDMVAEPLDWRLEL